MIFRICVLGAILFGFSMVGFGQTTRDVSAPKPPLPQYQGAKPAKKVSFFKRLIQKKNKKITGIEETRDFERRMKKTVRRKAKLEKESMQARYQDPTYFGHKKPPKKRKNGKKKFCKECGLWH